MNDPLAASTINIKRKTREKVGNATGREDFVHNFSLVTN